MDSRVSFVKMQMGSSILRSGNRLSGRSLWYDCRVYFGSIDGRQVLPLKRFWILRCYVFIFSGALLFCLTLPGPTLAARSSPVKTSKKLDREMRRHLTGVGIVERTRFIAVLETHGGRDRHDLVVHQGAHGLGLRDRHIGDRHGFRLR